MGGELPFDPRLDGGPVESYSTYSAAAGGRVLTIATVLPDHRLAFELISTYVGHAEVSGMSRTWRSGRSAIRRRSSTSRTANTSWTPLRIRAHARMTTRID